MLCFAWCLGLALAIYVLLVELSTLGLYLQKRKELAQSHRDILQRSLYKSSPEITCTLPSSSSLLFDINSNQHVMHQMLTAGCHE